MARTTPSLVVQAIEATYPWAKDRADGHGGQVDTLGYEHAPTIGMIVALVESLPDDLLPLDTQGHLAVVASLGAMRAALQNWASGAHPGHAIQLRPLNALGGKQPVVALLEVFRRCPDESPHKTAAGLEFVADERARYSIRTDISAAHRALGNGEFKAATVLAGSVIEALLLWRLSQLDKRELADAIKATSVRRKAKGQPTVSKRAPEYWTLSEFIDVAEESKVIDDTTAVNLRLSNDYRNLIHPGRVMRSGDDATLAIALSALGGMERLTELLVRHAAPANVHLQTVL